MNAMTRRHPVVCILCYDTGSFDCGRTSAFIWIAFVTDGN